MALFLNTEGFNYWIPKLIKEAEKELIIIVPYIQTSKNVLNALWKANKRGVQIVLVYREDKLSNDEKSKLLALDNINLLHHPNIHCKSYYNGNLLIIGSMNLYEYSQKNNREMGILLNKYEHEEIEFDGFGLSNDDESVFTDAINEIREIINGAHLEKISENSKANNFNIEVIKTNEELEIDFCNRINKYYLNKKFKPIKVNENLWYSICENFYDKVDVVFEDNRVAIKFNLNPNELKIVYDKWMDTYNEFEFDWFKYYWNYYKQDLLIYRNGKFDWDNINSREMIHNNYKEMFEAVIKKYRKLTGK